MMIAAGLVIIAGTAFAQPDQQQGQGPRGGRGGQPNPEQRLKHVTDTLTKKLSLNADQSAKVTAIYKSFFEEQQKLRPQPTPPPPPPVKPSKAKMDSLVNARDLQIQKVLTPAQFAKYKEVEKTLRQRGPGGGRNGRPKDGQDGDGQNPPPPPAPEGDKN